MFITRDDNFRLSRYRTSQHMIIVGVVSNDRFDRWNENQLRTTANN